MTDINTAPKPVADARADYGHLIGKRFVPSISGRTFPTHNPSDGGEIARLAEGDARDVDAAVAAAREAFEGPWSEWTPYQRQALLFRLHEVIDREFEDLARIESLDMGAPISRLLASRAAVLRMILFFAGQAGNIAGETLGNGLPGNVTTMTLKAPVGVIGGIIPWNGPLGSQWWIIGAVLATGCTAVLKPAEDASLSVLRTAELLLEAGVPPGVLNVVTGIGAVAGSALAAHPDVDRIAFTGSTETGRRVIEASTSNMKRLQLELGGKSPDIVFADADLDRAVPGAAMGVFANSGQICFAGTRVFVQREIINEFARRAAEFARGLKVGSASDETAQLGPLISERQLERVLSYVDIGVEEGARLVCGGERITGDLASGFYVEPTVFSDVTNDMRIAREEIFGPVMSIIPFDDADEVIRLANDSEYGLGGAVWSRDITTALSVVKGVHTGVMWVNCYGLIDPMVGFGGTKASGYGAKGGHAHLDTYLYTKCVYVAG